MWSTISGGKNNGVVSVAATVGGGENNHVYSTAATISGGNNNVINVNSCYNSTIGGGSANAVNGNGSTIGGGQANIANNNHATIGGGQGNQVNGDYGTVSGGYYNVAQSYCAIIGGNNNTCNIDHSVILGGEANQAGGKHSTVQGQYGASSLSNSQVIGFSIYQQQPIYGGRQYVTLPSGHVVRANSSANVITSEGQTLTFLSNYVYLCELMLVATNALNPDPVDLNNVFSYQRSVMIISNSSGIVLQNQPEVTMGSLEVSLTFNRSGHNLYIEFSNSTSNDVTVGGVLRFVQIAASIS
jgi:hypothetical protein